MTIAIECPCGARVRLLVRNGIATDWDYPTGRTEAAPVHVCTCGRAYRATDAHPWIESAQENAC